MNRIQKKRTILLCRDRERERDHSRNDGNNFDMHGRMLS
jgi:hypothetical protein